MYFLFNRTKLHVFFTYLTGALYVHPLWFYKHQHDNRVRSTQNAFSLPFAVTLVNCTPIGEMHNYCTPPIIKENLENFLIHRALYVHPLWFYKHQHDNRVRSTQNAFSLPFAATLVNCTPIGEMHNYCTPPIIKENLENFLIHRALYVQLLWVYKV
jgi:uncharacterized protein involved in tolerance to divalent cations